MKSLIVLLIALLLYSGIAFANPRSSFATTNNNNTYFNIYTRFLAYWRNLFWNNHENDNSFCKNHPNDRKCQKNDDANDCRKHPERNECHVSVPEFGAIPGAVALISSGGVFLFLKKRKS